MGFPNKLALRDLLNHHGLKIVNDEVFYQLMSTMLSDGREDIQKVAVIGLDASHSFESFIMLSEYLQQNGLKCTTCNRVSVAMTQYSRKSDLNSLVNVIYKSDITYAQIVAGEQINKIVKSLESSVTDNGQVGGLSERGLASKDLDYFDKLVPGLESFISNQNVDEQVRSQIEVTIKSIQDLING